MGPDHTRPAGLFFRSPVFPLPALRKLLKRAMTARFELEHRVLPRTPGLA